MAKDKTPAEKEEPIVEDAAAETEAPEAEAEAPAVEAPAEENADDLLAAEKEKYLRLYAEYDNFRKRSQKEREALFTAVRAETVTAMLPVYDNLERALKQGSTDEAFLKGIEMTMTQLTDILAGMGVQPIDAVGQKFDANLHNAVMHVEDEAHGENEIVEEFQKGFTLGDKVIRFSMVKVAN